ncbi:methionyl-tRNA formyltransferase [Candidatus Uhrbacteria bacterium]|nr:methionyl-tRNA formyltransferase [Candidatus Uhrbacteria bacterium]
MLKVAYFGSGHFAVEPLQAMLNDPDVQVLAVICRPDRPVGRRQETEPCPVGHMVSRSSRMSDGGIRILKPERVRNNPELIAELRGMNLDVAIVASYGQILPQELLDIPRLGFLNLHGSILPKWRGASPIQSSILAGDAETGVTLMVMDAKMDHGPILGTAETAIGPHDTYRTMETKLSKSAADLLSGKLRKFADGQIVPQRQDHDAASFCGMIGKGDGLVDWRKETADLIGRKLRAYTPWPGIYSNWNRNGRLLRIKILEAKIGKEPVPGVLPGTIVESEGKPSVIAADHRPVTIEMCQVEGKKPCSGQDLLRGYRDLAGKVI